ncbi:MAG: DUF1697 domain-containing protein [Nocardioides sp.]
MPTHIAFLRAINLGAKRKFPKDAIRSAAEGAGFTDVETYINTGNVRVTTTLRSRAKVEAALEEAFLADRGFEVPTIVFTPAELVAIASYADDLWAEYDEPGAHYVTLLKQPPSGAAVAAVETAGLGGELCRVRDRAAHVLLPKSFHENRLMNGKAFAALGVGTARNVTVIRELARRWGPGAGP